MRRGGIGIGARRRVAAERSRGKKKKQPRYAGAGFSSVVTGWEAGTRTLTLETETDQWFRPGNCTLVQPVSYDIAGI